MFAWLKSFLGIGEKTPPQKPPPLPSEAERVGRAELIRATPQLHPDVMRLSDKRYGCLLEWKLSEAQQMPPKVSWFPKVFFRDKKRRHRLILDDMGRRAVELIDGERPINVIARTLSEETGHRYEEMENAVLTFVTQLVSRNVASLQKRK